LELVAVIHTLGAYFLIVFVLVHVYLITTGHTVGSNLRAMVTGWDEMDDEEIKDIVEEAIEETGLKIKSMVKGQDEKEVKQLVMEALDGAKDKVEHNKLKGQF
jgi:hypothetical protein